MSRDPSAVAPVVADTQRVSAFDGESADKEFVLGDTSGANIDDVFEEVDLPDSAETGVVSEPTVDDATGEVRDEVPRRVEDRHFDEADDDREQGRRRLEEQTDDWNAYDPEALSSNEGDGSMAAVDAPSGTFGAFLAGLWGAIRGLGPASRRTGDNKDESDGSARRR